MREGTDWRRGEGGMGEERRVGECEIHGVYI